MQLLEVSCAVRQIYIYIYVCVCVCVCARARMCVSLGAKGLIENVLLKLKNRIYIFSLALLQIRLI